MTITTYVLIGAAPAVAGVVIGAIDGASWAQFGLAGAILGGIVAPMIWWQQRRQDRMHDANVRAQAAKDAAEAAASLRREAREDRRLDIEERRAEDFREIATVLRTLIERIEDLPAAIAKNCKGI
jgi:hypothetical protein